MRNTICTGDISANGTAPRKRHPAPISRHSFTNPRSKPSNSRIVMCGEICWRWEFVISVRCLLAASTVILTPDTRGAGLELLARCGKSSTPGQRSSSGTTWDIGYAVVFRWSTRRIFPRISCWTRMVFGARLNGEDDNGLVPQYYLVAPRPCRWMRCLVAE